MTSRITDRDQRISTMWLAGMKSEAIAAECGICRSNVAKRARKIGLPQRTTTKNRYVNLWPCIVAWARRGCTPEEIAVGIGCVKPDVVAAVGVRHVDTFVSRETKEEFRTRVIERVKALKRNEKKRWRYRCARAAAA